VRHVADRPYTLLSCGISIDGYLDSATEQRLLLSNDADLDRVDAVRATCDAILVGAATVRNDNPRLLVRAQGRRDERVARGLPSSPMKVTVTSGAKLDACANFFTTGTPRSSSTVRARRWTRPATGWGRWRPWSTAARR
jgi:5-amino-6-(5-phosphoribosylamino)uracil reductase